MADDFLDNIDKSLIDSSENEVIEEDSEERDLSVFPYVFFVKKTKYNFLNVNYNFFKSGSVYFDYKSLLYIRTLFETNSCIDRFVILIANSREGREYCDWTVLKLEPGMIVDNAVIQVMFRLKKNFKAADFRRLIMTLIHQDRCPLRKKESSIQLHRNDRYDWKGQKIKCLFDNSYPETTIMCAFYLCGCLDKYFDETGYEKAALELHRRAEAYSPMTGLYDADYLTKYFDENGCEEITTCVPLLWIERGSNTGNIYIEPVNRFGKVSLKISDKQLKYFEKYKDEIEDAKKSGMVTYDFAQKQGTNMMFSLNWYRKAIVIKEYSDDTESIPHLIVTIRRRKVAEFDMKQSYASDKHVYAIKLSRGITDEPEHMEYFSKKFMTSLFGIYKDCFDGTLVESMFEPGKSNGFVFNKDIDFNLYGYYRLRDEVDVRKFYKFIKEVLNYDSHFVIESLKLSFQDRSCGKMLGSDALSIPDHEWLMFEIFRFHHLGDEFINAYFKNLVDSLCSHFRVHFDESDKENFDNFGNLKMMINYGVESEIWFYGEKPEIIQSLYMKKHLYVEKFKSVNFRNSGSFNQDFLKDVRKSEYIDKVVMKCGNKECIWRWYKKIYIQTKMMCTYPYLYIETFVRETA